MSTKEKIKQYLDANVHDGQDRKGCHCDKAVFTPDELQELVEEACEYVLKEEKPKTIDFTKLPVDTLVDFGGTLLRIAPPPVYPNSVRLFSNGGDSLTMVGDSINVSCDEIKLVEGRKVVWEGGGCPLPDGVEVIVGWAERTVSEPHNCKDFGDGWGRSIIWYQIKGALIHSPRSSS